MVDKMRISGMITLLLLALFCLPALSAADDSGRAKEVVAMVDSAVKLIQEKGVAAFDEMNAPGGPWVTKTTSIFVGDPAGMELVNPGQPEMVGRNMLDYTDADGRKIVQEEWALVEAQGHGWVEGAWPKPGTDIPTRCRSYVKLVEAEGKRFIVGAAYYMD